MATSRFVSDMAQDAQSNKRAARDITDTPPESDDEGNGTRASLDPQPDSAPSAPSASRHFGLTIHRPNCTDNSIARDNTASPTEPEHDPDREPSYEPCTVDDYAWMLAVVRACASAKTRGGKSRIDWGCFHHEHSTAAAAGQRERAAPVPHLQCVIRTVSPAPVSTVRKWLQQLGPPGCSGMHVKPYRVDELEHALRYVKDPTYVPGGDHPDAKPSSYLFEIGTVPGYGDAGVQGKRTDLDTALDLYMQGKTMLEIKQSGVSAQAIVQTANVGPKLFDMHQQSQQPKLRYVADIKGPPGNGKTCLIRKLVNVKKTAFIRADSNWMGAIKPTTTTVVIDEFCGQQPFKALMSMLCGMLPTQYFGKGTEFYAPQIERFIFASLHGIAHYYRYSHENNGSDEEINKQVNDRITHHFEPEAPDDPDNFNFKCTKNLNARCLNKPEWDDVERDEV